MLTARLREALASAAQHAQTADDSATLTQCAKEASISLPEVQLISRLLRAAREEGGGGDDDGRGIWVHELLLGASPVLPARAQRAPAPPELKRRLEALRAAEADREYAALVGSTSGRTDDSARDAAEMSTYRSQMGVGLNLIVSMATMFTVGCYAGGTEAQPMGVRAVVSGLVLMLLAMAVEMGLFVIGASRIDEQVHKRDERARRRGLADRTRLHVLPKAGTAK